MTGKTPKARAAHAKKIAAAERMNAQRKRFASEGYRKAAEARRLERESR